MQIVRSRRTANPFYPLSGRTFFDFENFHMTDVWAPWIDSGEVTIFTVDTIDAETWSNTNGDPRFRICRHERLVSSISPMRWFLLSMQK